jgi:hypothetical protein
MEANPYQDLAEINPEALTADGFEDAYIGHTTGNFSPAVAVYDYDKCVEVMMGQGLSHEEAVEYIDFNTVGAYVGNHGPIYIHPRREP